MTVTLVLPQHIADELRLAAKADLETAGVLLARVVDTPLGNTRLLGRRVVWVTEDAYLTREADHLSIASSGYVPALADAEADGSIALWLHTHPGNGSSPRASKHDALVDRQLADLFRLRANCDLYGALTIAHHDGQLRFTGHVETAAERSDIDRLWVTGRRMYRVENADHTATPCRTSSIATSGLSAATFSWS